MGLLTPFFLAGLAAIALPLVFHLIRRTPRGQTPFSSLMFLSPSPPRITRRSRLDNLLLLLLRALALALLALAFARPFFRELSQLAFDAGQGQQVAILVDASASMRRSDLWRQAQREVQVVLDDLGPADRVALFAFDRDVRTLLDFDDQTEIDPRRRLGLAARRLQEIAPTWTSTDLGNALSIVAERLDARNRAEESAADLRRRLVLVSDFSQGARLDALQGYAWPEGVELEVKTLAPADPTNAGLHLAGGLVEAEEAASEAGEEAATAEQDHARIADPGHRVRVVNSADATAEQFQLVWLTAEDQPVGNPLKIYVPPGQGRVATVPRPATSEDVRLVLRGDGHPFDNTLHLAPPVKEDLTVVYLGADPADDPDGLRYYVQRAFPDAPRRRVQVIAPQPTEPLQAPDAPPPDLVVVTQTLDEQRSQELRRYLERGGAALLAATDVAAAESWKPLLAPVSFAVEESAPADYALLGELDFTHPLLAPFADPRYSDFTKVHFWKHRRLTFTAAEGDSGPGPRMLARFDNRDPALVELAVGQGKVYLWASSWRPDDSQLARSSKFVPLLLGMAGAGDGSTAPPVYVGDALRWPPAFGAAPHSVRKPDGVAEALGDGVREFRETDQPGIYVVGERSFAVHLDPAESHTAPRSVEELEQYGVRLTDPQRRQAEEQRERQLRDVELENRQKIWRWLLAAALVVLILETWLAAR